MAEQNPLVWEGGTLVAVRAVPVPESPPGWVPVDVAYAGICGSDLHIAAGEHGRAQPGIYQRSDIEAAIELVITGRFDAHRLISKVFPLNEAAPIDSLRRGEGMKVLIKLGQAQAA